MVVVRTEAECRLDAAQQALLEAQASAASTVKQVEMLASQLVAAERKVNQVEQEKAAWIDKILTQRKEKKGSNKLGSQ
ncbi:hypothetical protein FB597_1011008 [Herbaspirillum sp. SJZ099]|nr:hypothetical protein FB597_1011008 [Herbaspirillum sp. SJZ099]